MLELEDPWISLIYSRFRSSYSKFRCRFPRSNENVIGCCSGGNQQPLWLRLDYAHMARAASLIEQAIRGPYVLLVDDHSSWASTMQVYS